MDREQYRSAFFAEYLRLTYPEIYREISEAFNSSHASDARTCRHFGTSAGCDCDTIAAELAGQD